MTLGRRKGSWGLASCPKQEEAMVWMFEIGLKPWKCRRRALSPWAAHHDQAVELQLQRVSNCCSCVNHQTLGWASLHLEPHPRVCDWWLDFISHSLIIWKWSCSLEAEMRQHMPSVAPRLARHCCRRPSEWGSDIRLAKKSFRKKSLLPRVSLGVSEWPGVLKMTERTSIWAWQVWYCTKGEFFQKVESTLSSHLAVCVHG